MGSLSACMQHTSRPWRYLPAASALRCTSRGNGPALGLTPGTYRLKLQGLYDDLAAVCGTAMDELRRGLIRRS